MQEIIQFLELQGLRPRTVRTYVYFIGLFLELGREKFSKRFSNKQTKRVAYAAVGYYERSKNTTQK